MISSTAWLNRDTKVWWPSIWRGAILRAALDGLAEDQAGPRTAVRGHRLHAGRERLDSLLVAECRDGTLRYVAELTAGFTAQAQADLNRLLASRVRPRPVVPCGKRAVWVEPELYCLVQFQQWTSGGCLRGASFRGWLASPRPEAGGGFPPLR